MPQSGSTQVTPQDTTDYVLHCSGRGGSSPQHHLPLGILRVDQLIGGKLQEVNP